MSTHLRLYKRIKRIKKGEVEEVKALLCLIASLTGTLSMFPRFWKEKGDHRIDSRAHLAA